MRAVLAAVVGAVLAGCSIPAEEVEPRHPTLRFVYEFPERDEVLQ